MPAMKWKTLQQGGSSYGKDLSVADIAKVEALRAIAEQLDELNDHLASVVRAIRAGNIT